MEIESYLYDADGSDQIVEVRENFLDTLNDNQLLWINLLNREEETLEYAARVLNLKNLPVKKILKVSARPSLEKFGNFYRFFIVSVEYGSENTVNLIPIDFIVGKNFVITVHSGAVGYYSEFIESDRGETLIGGLDAESFVASLLDLHIVTYFRVMEKIENQIDKLDEKILKKDLENDIFLDEIVKLRRNVSRVRRCLLPHRDVFYALSRPDFIISDCDSETTFQHLNEHFETCAETVESSRESVLSLFDLYTTKTSHQMNFLIKRLTFITLLLGGMGVVAGIMGMNFEESFFKDSHGFWIVIGSLILTAVILTIIGYKKRWI